MAAEVDDTNVAETNRGDDVSEVIAELAEAEAAEAEALADAARARAMAIRIGADGPGKPARRRWSRRLAFVAGVLLVCGMLTVTGLMIWQHRQMAAHRAHDAQFVEAARTGVVALLSIDYNHAKADVQRVIDASTETFKEDFARDADNFVKTAQDSKAVTVGSVSAAALESVNGDTGVVLLATSSKVTNANGAEKDPRSWRMSVTVARDGDQLKMSNVEFVP